MHSQRDEILDTAPDADRLIWEGHVRGFISAFVQKNRRERWRHLLLSPSDKKRKASNKLFSDLDRTKCSDLTTPWNVNPTAMGVFDDFTNNPKMLTFELALDAGQLQDAIFSMRKGELALFFFHHGEILLCENP